jgi:hypothetical protein
MYLKIPRLTMGPIAAANALIDTELWIVIQASQCPRPADGRPPAIGCISLQAARVAREHQRWPHYGRYIEASSLSYTERYLSPHTLPSASSLIVCPKRLHRPCIATPARARARALQRRRQRPIHHEQCLSRDQSTSATSGEMAYLVLKPFGALDKLGQG